MIEVELAQKDVHLLLAGMKIAEVEFGNRQEWTASKAISKLYDSLYRQVFTYGQISEANTNNLTY